ADNVQVRYIKLIAYEGLNGSLHGVHVDGDTVNTLLIPLPEIDGELAAADLSQALRNSPGPDLVIRDLETHRLLLVPTEAGNFVMMTGEGSTDQYREFYPKENFTFHRSPRGAQIEGEKKTRLVLAVFYGNLVRERRGNAHPDLPKGFSWRIK